MSLFDSIKDAASSFADAAGDSIADAKRTMGDIARAVERVPAKLATGAAQALNGAAKLGRDFAKDPVGTIRSSVPQAIEGAKRIGRTALDGLKQAGEWAWEHKGQIGFWTGTAALLLAVPLSGGATGALAGGMMAARGAAIAAKVAQSGRIGATAVKLAKAGASAVSSARSAIAGTKVGAVAERAGAAVHAGRVAFGGTRIGKTMIAAQKPVTAASTVLAGVNFADTTRRYAKGEASNKDLVLATLGFAPTGVGVVRGAAARRAAQANAKASAVVTRKLDVVAQKAADASQEAAHVAFVAPRVAAPRTAGVAAEAREEAADTVGKAIELRQRTALTTRAPDADDAISATSLSRELDDVASQARSARESASHAVDLAPTELIPSVRRVRAELDDAQAVASRAKQAIQGLATQQRRADFVADGAEKLEDAIGTTALHAGIINNGLKSVDEQGSGVSLTDGAFVRGITSWLLGRNASRAAAIVPNYVPPPAAARANAT